jgi:hypothetical protein
LEEIGFKTLLAANNEEPFLLVKQDCAAIKPSPASQFLKRDNAVMALSYCSVHNAWLPRDCFYPASLRAHESRCKRCNGQGRWARRCKTLPGRLQWNLYQRERKLGGVYPSAAFVQHVLDMYAGKSVLSGDTSSLCITRYYSDLPLHVHAWNALLVTSAEARLIGRSAPAPPRELFPLLVNAFMERQRLLAMGQ